MSYDRHLASELEKEEARMEAREVEEAKLDQRKADYIRELLTEFVTYRYIGKTRQMSAFEYEVWNDWTDSSAQDPSLIHAVRLNLAAGDREKAGMVLVESIEAYMDKIAAKAVREDMKL
jgi:myo-inositol-1-phosphate synthase